MSTQYLKESQQLKEVGDVTLVFRKLGWKVAVISMLSPGYTMVSRAAWDQHKPSEFPFEIPHSLIFLTESWLLI